MIQKKSKEDIILYTHIYRQDRKGNHKADELIINIILFTTAALPNLHKGVIYIEVLTHSLSYSLFPPPLRFSILATYT